MAGIFVFTKYQLSYNSGKIATIRVQPETLAATSGSIANAAPAAAVTEVLPVMVGGSGRRRGIHARLVYLSLAQGSTPPAGYSLDSKTSIPALTLDFYAQVLQTGLVSYLSTVWRASTRPEIVRNR